MRHPEAITICQAHLNLNLATAPTPGSVVGLAAMPRATPGFRCPLTASYQELTATGPKVDGFGESSVPGDGPEAPPKAEVTGR